MSLNPNRHQKQQKQRRRSPIRPYLKHSEIMKRQQGHMLPLEGKIATTYGMTAKVFASDDFEVSVKTINNGNSFAIGMNAEKDCVYKILQGQAAIITISDEGEKKIEQLQENAFFNAPKGLKYGIYTYNNVDLVLLEIKSANYDKGWIVCQEEEITKPSVISNSVSFDNPQIVNQVQIPDVVRNPLRSRRKNKSKNNKQYNSDKSLTQSISTSNSSNVSGVNLKPRKFNAK